MEGMLEVADRGAALVQIERLGLFPVMVDTSKAGVAAAEKAEKRDIAPRQSTMPAVLRAANDPVVLAGDSWRCPPPPLRQPSGRCAA